MEKVFWKHVSNVEEYKGEPGGGEVITEQSGYIPPQVQIEQMILAGQRLDQARKEMFDAEDITEINPLRRPGIDMAEVSQLALETQKSLIDQKTKAELKAIDDKKAAEVADQSKKVDG